MLHEGLGAGVDRPVLFLRLVDGFLKAPHWRVPSAGVGVVTLAAAHPDGALRADDAALQLSRIFGANSGARPAGAARPAAPPCPPRPVRSAAAAGKGRHVRLFEVAGVDLVAGPPVAARPAQP